ncbi:MAG: hypothetical protein JW780_04765 [Clostridiales bacterium]|nr:hypothetical protein [Clostridiales bacterium]
MSIKYRIKENRFNSGKAFYAVTTIDQRTSEEKLMAYMAMKGTSLTSIELRGVIDLFKQSVRELLAEGNRIVLDDFLILYPSVTAGFDTPAESFNHKRDRIGIRCRVSRSLASFVRNATVVEKQDENERQPNLTRVISGINRENVIRWPYATTLKGNNLNEVNRTIGSITIFSRDDSRLVLTVPASDLIIDSRSKKGLSFSISNQVVIPTWLTPGLPVYLRIEYSGSNPLLNRVSTEVKTYWQSLPENRDADRTVTENIAA